MSDIVVDPKEPVEVKSYDGTRRYWIRPPKAWEGDKFRQEVTAEGARSWGRQDLLEAMREAVETEVDGDGEAEIAERKRLAGIITDYGQRLNEAAEAMRNERTAETRKAFADAWTMPPDILEIEGMVLEAGRTRYSRMVGENRIYPLKAGKIAAKLFLVGWEGVKNAKGEDVPFRRSSMGGVPDDLLQMLGDDRAAISSKVHDLIQPEEFRLGNSESEPSGSASPTSSSDSTKEPPQTSQSTPEADGTSTG